MFKSFILISGILIVSSCVPFANKKEASKLNFKETPLSTSPITEDQKKVSIDAYKVTLFPLLQKMTCINCHGDAKKYQPYYAVSDVNASWQTILNDAKKVDLETPESSRVYLRIKNEHHNCLTDGADQDCNAEAAEVLNAITKWKEMTKASTVASTGIKTGAIAFKDSVLNSAETEYGTLMLEAEQEEFPEAMIGRFNTESDGFASNYKYALTAMPPVNPGTTTTRTPMIVKGDACEVTTSAMLKNSVNGPFQITEDGTHVNSGAVTNSGLVIKDGNRPFSIGIRSVIVRPDKRLDYAKMLTGWESGSASGVSLFNPMTDFALTNGTFNFGKLDLSSAGRNSSHNTNAINVSDFQLAGNLIETTVFKTLPYFMNHDSVFQAMDNTFIDDPNLTLKTYKNENLILKNLFKLPINDLSTSDIHAFFEKNDNDGANTNKFRKDLVFKFIKNSLDNIAVTAPKYAAIENMDANHFYSLYGNLKVDIKACPNGVCTTTSQVLEVTPGSDAGGVPLTYENALDILKVDNAGTSFVAGSAAELQAGKAFRRMDVYAHIYEPVGGAKTFGDTFDQTFYSYSNGVFSQKSKLSYPMALATSNLDLRAFFLNSANTLSKSDSLANFQKTLFPVLQKSTCISCHAGSVAGRVQHSSSNSVTAFNEIDRVKLVNFTTPTNSFRRAVFPAETRIVHNCGTDAECAATQTDFINAIKQWGVANEASKLTNVALPFTELSEKERTPGMLEYKFKANKTGKYNIWTKIKSTNGFAINLRVLDGTNPIKPYTQIQNPMIAANSCVRYTFTDNPDWTWFTPGRADDLLKVDSRGVLKKDVKNVPLVLSDNRTYWSLEAGKTYTLQIFEAAALTKIDAVAIDYVANFKDILDFQPDLLARDENNIADYKKQVLTYDISKIVGLTGTKKAYFKVEVKSALGGQNYIFRNPRILSPDANIAVKTVKVLINSSASYSDASWNNIDVTTGDDKILTFAPLVTLVKNGPASDTFQFSFEKLALSTKVVAELDPRGSSPIVVDGRKCRELDLFINTVKPIFRNARLMLKEANGINDYIGKFPGTTRQGPAQPQTYQCMTCHNDSHPYFKMTTFDYPEILCAQALSRVDFTNYRDSLLVRGIDGSGVHPKLHFVEELQYKADMSGVVEYNADDGVRILDGQIKNQATNDTPAVFSKWIQNAYFSSYIQSDLGLSAVWANNTEAKKNTARLFMGQLKRVEFVTLPNLSTFTFYEPLVHDVLSGKIRSEADDLVAGTFVANSVNLYNIYTPTATDTATALNRPIAVNYVKDGSNHISVVAGKKVLTTAQTADDYNNRFETLKAQYRTVILNWIAKEHEHIKNGD